jgi:hypothetical protein
MYKNKTLKSLLTNLNWKDFYVGRLLADDDFYKENKIYLDPEKFCNNDHIEIIKILKNYDNSIESILQNSNKRLAGYAMELCNLITTQEFNEKYKVSNGKIYSLDDE